MAAPSPSAAPSHAADLVTQTQLKVTELCRAYFTSVGHLQNEAGEVPLDESEAARRERAECCRPLAAKLAEDIVRMHRDVDELIDALEKAHCSEEEQLRRLRAEQVRDTELTAGLRAKVVDTEALRAGLRRELNTLLGGMRSVDSS